MLEKQHAICHPHRHTAKALLQTLLSSKVVDHLPAGLFHGQGAITPEAYFVAPLVCLILGNKSR